MYVQCAHINLDDSIVSKNIKQKYFLTLSGNKLNSGDVLM